jgi:hypothetical protein
MSPRQYRWGVAAAIVGAVAFWSGLAALVGVPTVWVVVLVLVAGVNMAVAGVVGYRSWLAANYPQSARAASPHRGPNIYIEDIVVKMMTGMSFPPRTRTSTPDATSATGDYQGWGYRLSLIAQCGLWPLVLTIACFTWHEPIPAWACLLLTVVAAPWAIWQIVKELRSDT